jgi:hypothetical protein
MRSSAEPAVEVVETPSARDAVPDAGTCWRPSSTVCSSMLNRGEVSFDEAPSLVAAVALGLTTPNSVLSSPAVAEEVADDDASPRSSCHRLDEFDEATFDADIAHS